MSFENSIKYVCGVYVLTGDLNGEQIVKVGKTEAGLSNRVKELNRCRYGGVSHWKVHAWLDSCSERVATAVEGIAHHLLYQHQIMGLPNGHGGQARELFSINASDAADAVWNARNEINGSIFIRSDDKASQSQIRKRKSYSWSWLLVITALSFLGLVVAANAKADMDVCLNMSEAANTTMTARQQGAPMEAIIGIARNLDIPSTEREAFINMIVDAYDYPKLSIKENQVEAAKEFSAKYLVECLRDKS